MNKSDLTIDKLSKGEVSSLEMSSFCVERMEKNEDLNVYISRTPSETILAQAKEADLAKEKGDSKGRLLGFPMAIKDNMCTEGVKTTCASKILGNFVPNYDATVVKKIKAEGGIILGKANMDEFAMGSSNENSAFGVVRNPWNKDCVPGGSSGGSAAAVASGLAAAALGSDTGGSIRQPAAFCGVVGMKPTYGRVSRFGLVAFASSLDQIGPITNNVRDNAKLLEIISGHDPLDSTSVDIPVPPYEELLEKDIGGLKIGIPIEYFSDALNPQIKKGIEASMDVLKRLGAEFTYVSLPTTEYAIPCYYVLAPAEASSNLARYDGVRYGVRRNGDSNLINMYHETRSQGFGKEVKRRIMLGTYTLSSGYYDAYYLKALKTQKVIREEFSEVFKKVDIIISPVTPNLPFKIGEKTADPLEMYLSDIYTVSVNLAGLPAISMPCGLVDGLPIGVQLIGNHFKEDIIYRVAHQLEEALSLNLPDPCK
ncbi:MAG: Asp-tRNA(Asn)/Glu-tRNA(Gln) amidotransferase subunit GatA [Nitrospinota bacterium]|nr:Asp-tRNA(Asn)/Glu-tRNA(Gln) amidotransferase subunit GatA [Nitrospinota bacterium]